MAITETCHVGSVAGSGAVSVVVICQKVEEPHGICRRKWSRIMVIMVVCQGVMEPHEIHRRKWSSIVAVIVTCQGVMEPHGIHRRKWSSIVAVTTTYQGGQACRPKFDGSPISIEARTGIIYRGVSAKAARGSKLK